MFKRKNVRELTQSKFFSEAVCIIKQSIKKLSFYEKKATLMGF